LSLIESKKQTFDKEVEKVIENMGKLYVHYSKISPITGQRCPEGPRKLRFTDYMTVAQDGGKVVSLTHRPLLHPRKYS